MPSSSIADQILAGDHDSLLEQILDAADARVRALAIQSAARLAVGDRVVLKSIKPKYLTGATAVVQTKNVPQGRIGVALDASVRKFPAGYYMLVPSACVEAVQS